MGCRGGGGPAERSRGGGRGRGCAGGNRDCWVRGKRARDHREGEGAVDGKGKQQ